MEFSLAIPAFIAGILTFLAPCTLPLVPAYLGFISGISLEDLQDSQKSKLARRKILLNGLLFVIGFSSIFIFFGIAAGLFGQVLSGYRVWLSRISGVFVILFGFSMLNLWRIPFLSKGIHIEAPQIFQRGKAVNSFIFGVAFGLGWTPCVGPVLGSILALAATSATVGQGAFILSVFSLGLAIPFLVVAAGMGSVSTHIARLSKCLNIVSIIGGVFLIFLGILLFANKLGLWIAYFYQFFDFINYNRLLDYL